MTDRTFGINGELVRLLASNSMEQYPMTIKQQVDSRLYALRRLGQRPTAIYLDRHSGNELMHDCTKGEMQVSYSKGDPSTYDGVAVYICYGLHASDTRRHLQVLGEVDPL